MRREILAWLWAVWMGMIPVTAHVGSPFIVFEGRAGNFPVQVVVRQPDVVPGLAHISVEVLRGSPERVRVLPLHWNTDRSGAPRADIAERVKGTTNRYSAALWLMTRGAYGIEVEVEGSGGGAALVPVNSVAHVRQPMPAWLGGLLAFLGLGLVVGLIGIIVAAAREATLPAGVRPGGRRGRPALVAGVAGTAIAAGLLYGGAYWWKVEDRHHETRILYRQFSHELTSVSGEEGDAIRLSLTDARRHDPAYRLIPDHGHLVHLFLVGEEEEGAGVPAFAHLHPREVGSDEFVSPLALLPAGRYRSFVELSHSAGFTQTLTNSIHLTAPSSGQLSDPADAVALPLPEPTSAQGQTHSDTADLPHPADLGDGIRLRLETSPWRSEEPVVLKARVTHSDGSPAVLEPYLRMLGHAVVARDDGSVFAHLHPAGTLSMAATRVFATKLGGEAGAQAADANCGDLEAVPPAVAASLGRSGEVGFPYVFPQAGRYFVWIQVRVGGRIRTAPFVIKVNPGS